MRLHACSMHIRRHGRGKILSTTFARNCAQLRSIVASTSCSCRFLCASQYLESIYAHMAIMHLMHWGHQTNTAVYGSVRSPFTGTYTGADFTSEKNRSLGSQLQKVQIIVAAARVYKRARFIFVQDCQLRDLCGTTLLFLYSSASLNTYSSTWTHLDTAYAPMQCVRGCSSVGSIVNGVLRVTLLSMLLF